MYNRYIRNDDGVYQRIPQPEGPSRQQDRAGAPHQPSQDGPSHRQASWEEPPPPRREDREEPGEGRGFLDKILRKLNLGDIDKGDILLLLILLFLFDQGEDEELLIALGLLFLL